MTGTKQDAKVSQKSAIKIGKKAFLLSAGIILVLMLVSGILTIVLPSGEYQRVIQDGKTLVVNGTYHEVPKPNYPAWRWLTAPVEILFAQDNVALITIIIFIFCVGGSISILEGAGIMEELVKTLVQRFSKRKYLLIAVIIFFFMAISSFIGVYEGMVPMIIFIVPLAISLGWDSLTGLGLSLLPLAFGFASAVTNPFTIAVAQRIADLPLFSGSWLRIIFFIIVYGIVTAFVIRHAKKVERNPASSLTFKEDEAIRASLAAGEAEAAHNTAAPNGGKHTDTASSRAKTKGLIWFASCVGAAMAIVLVTARMPGLSDLAFPVMALLFLIGGIGGGLLAKVRLGDIGATFIRGAGNLLPGIVLILMAYSVKHIIISGKIMDTILHGAATLISQAPPLSAAFLVYLTTLVMNFFIGSASAKAFLMMPLLTPLADLVGITRQTAVLAFDFGDGFSNMIFPTNALLLIALSFTVVSYPRWMRWTWKLQAIILVVTSIFLAIAVGIRFGPF
ncbi:MAG: Na+/H+ antiporter NhaC family protein [Spirochaetia bacterium]|nr:Na+/H+ antiporter NhaC family protein [Spirochaetia bacterium]